jgi:hypothetical protein
MKNPSKERNRDYKKAKSYYLKIGNIFCPALNDDITFNSVGFRHLLRKQGKRRLKNEQQRRFSLLPYAECMLTDPKAIFISTNKTIIQQITWHGRKIKTVSSAQFWNTKTTRDGHTVTILVRQINNGKKHFFSIY